MKSDKTTVDIQLGQLASFLTRNKDLNLATINLKDEGIAEGLPWQTSDNRPSILTQLQSYQRLSKLLPKQNDQLIIQLLDDGMTSALNIAEFSKEKFVEKYGPRFEKHGFDAAAFYDNALNVKANVLLEYMRQKQQSEPHVRQTNLSSKISAAIK